MCLAEPMRRDGQRDDLNTFVTQRFDFLGTGSPTDVALGCFVVVNLSRFFRKRATNVLGRLDYLVDELCEHLDAKVGVLVRQTFRRLLLACLSARSPDVTGADALPSDLYEVGTLVMIKRMERIDDTIQLIVHGTERVRVLE